MPNLPELAGRKMAFQPEGLDERQNSFPFKCLVFFTFVLLMAPQLIFPFLQPLSLAKMSAGLAIAAYVLNRFSRGARLTVMLPEVRLTLCFVFLAMLSIPWSLWPGGSWNRLLDQFLKSVAIFLLIANLVTTLKRMRILIGSMVLWGVIMAVPAIKDFATGNLANQGVRIAGYDSPLAMNPNDLAMILNILLGLTFGLFLENRGAVNRLLLCGAMGLLGAGVIVTFSRAGFLGLVMAVVVSIARLVPKHTLLAISVVLGSVAVGLATLPEGYGTRLYTIYNIEADVTGSAMARLELMKYAFSSILSHPLGVGLGMDVLGVRDVGSASWSLVHNMYLQIAVELGLPGLILFLCLIFRLSQGLHRSLKGLKDLSGAERLYALGCGIQISLMSFLVNAFFAPVAHHFYFYYTAGFAVAFQGMTQKILAEQELLASG